MFSVNTARWRLFTAALNGGLDVGYLVGVLIGAALGTVDSAVHAGCPLEHGGEPPPADRG
jgi:hypothetical protein